MPAFPQDTIRRSGCILVLCGQTSRLSFGNAQTTTAGLMTRPQRIGYDENAMCSFYFAAVGSGTGVSASVAR